jgi:hypothetical protein
MSPGTQGTVTPTLPPVSPVAATSFGVRASTATIWTPSSVMAVEPSTAFAATVKGTRTTTPDGSTFRVSEYRMILRRPAETTLPTTRWSVVETAGPSSGAPAVSLAASKTRSAWRMVT